MLKKNGMWKGKEIKEFNLPEVETEGNNNKTRLRKYGPFKPDIFLKFLGWYISEGCTGYNYKVSIYQIKNNEYVEEIISILKYMGFNVHYYEPKGEISVNSKQLWTYCKQFGKSHDKYIPKEILNATKEQIMVILTTLFKGDGTLYNNQFNTYTTVSEQLKDNIIEMILKVGLSPCVSYINNNYYTIGVNYKCLTPRITNGMIPSYYEGYVYCPYVNNKPIMISRNGKYVWGSNYQQEWESPGIREDADYLITFKVGTRVSIGDIIYWIREETSYSDTIQCEVVTTLYRKTGSNIDYIEVLARKKA